MTQVGTRRATRSSGLAIWGPLVALWLIWGSTYLNIAIVGTSMPPMLANGFRFVVAALVLGGVLVVARGPRFLAITLEQLRSVAIMGVALLGVGIGTVSMAERYVPSGVTALLIAVMPLWVILLRMRAGDRPARLTLIGVAVGMIGLVLMLVPGGTRPVSGGDGDVVVWSIALMLSSFCWAFFSFRSTRYVFPRNTLVTTTYEMLFAGAALLGVGALRGERLHLEQVSTASWWALAYLIVASIAGYTAYTWLLAHAPLSLTATYAYVNPVVAVLLGFLIIGEVITSDVIVGLTVVVGGVALVVTGERR
ncbi:MAG: EamA family transporter [Actinobacteria bacterium]|nr:EamA family transporter [Actinomycetota bacterium]